jgi:hypothetical protein
LRDREAEGDGLTAATIWIWIHDPARNRRRLLAFAAWLAKYEVARLSLAPEDAQDFHRRFRDAIISQLPKRAGLGMLFHLSDGPPRGNATKPWLYDLFDALFFCVVTGLVLFLPSPEKLRAEQLRDHARPTSPPACSHDDAEVGNEIRGDDDLTPLKAA